MFKVIFDDVDITEILKVTNLERGASTNQESIIKNKKNKRGVSYLGTTTSLMTHKMTFILRHDLIDKRRELAKVLNVHEPKKLIYSDEPDKFYWAKASGDTDISEKNFIGYGEISWEIYDGVAFSVNELLFTNENENYIIVNNSGTEPMSLSLEASFSSDNGFLGIQNEDYSTKVLFGNIEEVDGFDYQKSDLLFDDHFNIDRGWKLNEGYTPPVTPERKQVGTVEYKDKPLGFVRPTDYGTGNSWHGPSLTKTVPVDKNGKYPINWRSDFRIDFNTDGGGALKYRQVGHESVSYADATGNIIASVVFEDNNVSQEKSDLVFYVEGKRVWSRMNTNDYYQNMSDDRYSFIVEKIGDYITFRHSQSKTMQKFRLSNPNAELRFVTWYAAAYKTHPPITNNLIRAINLRKHNVDYWQDIPNKFANGDTLKYWQEGQNLFCEVNDVNFLQFRDPGSTKIVAPPGQSVFYLAYSDFSAIPKVSLRGRAEYI